MAFTVALDVSCPVPKPVPESAARLIRAIIYAVLIRATDTRTQSERIGVIETSTYGSDLVTM